LPEAPGREAAPHVAVNLDGRGLPQQSGRALVLKPSLKCQAMTSNWGFFEEGKRRHKNTLTAGGYALILSLEI
jgi:hypothetical protein